MPSELEQRGYSLLVALPLRQGSWAKVTLERSLARSVGPNSARRGRSPGGVGRSLTPPPTRCTRRRVQFYWPAVQRSPP